MLFRSNDTATTEIYTLSLHDALPILAGGILAQMVERKIGEEVAKKDPGDYMPGLIVVEERLTGVIGENLYEAKRQEKASQNANRYDPTTFEERMPIPAKIEHLQTVGILRCQGHAWFVGIGRNGRSRQRMGRVYHGKRLAEILHQEVRSQRRRRKISAKRYFRAQ